MSNLDYSKFKKTSCDKNCTTLMHEGGHILRIAHNSVSKKMKDELDKLPMADGGEIGVNRAPDKSKPGVSRMGEYVRESSGNPQKNGEKHLARETAQKTLREMDRSPKPNIKGLANGGRIKAADGLDATLSPDYSDPATGQDAVANAPATIAPKPYMPSGPDQAGDPDMTDAQPQSDQSKDQEPSQENQPAPDQSAEEPAETTAPQMPAPPSIGKALTGPQAPQDTKLALDDEYVKAKQDYMSGKINPETYSDLFAKKDTMGKVGTLFGLLASGFGSGLSHQPNMVMDMMNKEIERDLDAQKTTKSNQLNFFNALNQHHLTQANVAKTNADIGLVKANTALTNDNQAMTHMQLAIMAKTLGMANNLPPGPTKQNAMQAGQAMSNAIDQNVNQRNAQTAQQLSNNSEAEFQQRNKALSMFPAGSPANQLGQYESQHHIPGTQGETSEPATPSDRQVIEGHQKLAVGLQDLMDFAKNNTTLVPGTPAYNVGQAKVRKLQSMIRENVLGTVYREGEQPLLDKFVNSNPAGIQKWNKTMPQLQELQAANLRDLNVKKKNLGLPIDQGSPSSGPQIKTSGGVKYMRGPDGKAIPVK